mmetsp:Transcript_48384/g.149364  ORF Transcript_48384/g.149364 Transcript_48384/m.149364 type:complete len:121 (-) Transcript_48384:75-437(-)
MWRAFFAHAVPFANKSQWGCTTAKWQLRETASHGASQTTRQPAVKRVASTRPPQTTLLMMHHTLPLAWQPDRGGGGENTPVGVVLGFATAKKSASPVGFPTMCVGAPGRNPHKGEQTTVE